MPHGLPRLRLRRRAFAAVAAALVTVTCAPLQAQAPAPSEAAVKARLTLSLTRFAQWPGGATGEALRLCLAQSDSAMAQAFSEVDGQVVNGRRVQVVKAPPVAGCHVLFVHASSERIPDLIRTATGDGGVLIVGDADGLLASGGMVEFVSVNDAIRFDVNMAAVRQARLALSSQVLKLARQVRE